VYNLRNTLFHICYRFQTAIFDFSLDTLTSSCTNIRPTMLFDAKDMRILLKFHIYSISNVRFKCFWFHVCYFYFRLNSHRTVRRATLLSAAVTSASSKTNAVTLNLLPKVIYTLVTKFITFSPKNHLHRLHFRWRNLIMGWTISKISTSFYQALMDLGIRRSAMENSDGQLRYSRKKTGVQLCTPPPFEG